MRTGMFQISIGDVWRGLVMATIAPLFVAVTAVLGSVIQAPNFDVFTVQWLQLAHTLANVSIVVSYGAFTGYIGKNLLTNSEGSFMGIVTKN